MIAYSIRPLRPSDEPVTSGIMRSLPEWFGHEGGLQSCADAVRSGSGWALEVDGEPVAFATWEERTSDTAEITWMAVHRSRRNTGIGTILIEAACDDLRTKGYRLALAMTSASHKTPVPGPDVYDETRAFWRRRGFYSLAELDIWDTDVALLMVRPL